MAVRQITKLLGEIPVRRVEGGDGWVDRANAEIGETIFSRAMTGEELVAKYITLPQEQKDTADAAFEINETEMSELVDEVYRIREDVVEKEKDSAKDSWLQTFGLLFSMFLTAFGLIAVFLVIMTQVTNKQVPEGYVFQLGKALFEYLINSQTL